LTELSATQEGSSYVFKRLANKLCETWEIEDSSSKGQRNSTVTSNHGIPVHTTNSPHNPKHTSLTTSISPPSLSEEEEEEDTTSSDSEESEDEIINFKPANQKPSFKFEPSALGASLPSFLAALKSSNDGLAGGITEDQKFELSDSDSDEPHIEMNLGLGVLEDTAVSIDTPVSISKKRRSLSDDEDDAQKFKPTVEEDSPSKKLKLLHTDKTQDPPTQLTLSSTTSNTHASSHTDNTVKVTLKLILPPCTNSPSTSSISNFSRLHLIFQTPEKMQDLLVSDSLATAPLPPTNEQREPSVPTYTEPSEEETADLLDSIVTYLRGGWLAGFTTAPGT
jgi:hypothetical protein